MRHNAFGTHNASMVTTSSIDALRSSAFASCGLQVIQRGWLSSNCILFSDDSAPAVVDTGYSTHSKQTVDLVSCSLKGKPLARIYNTHLHSDHCGGNKALQDQYPHVRTWIPSGEIEAVNRWDTGLLSFHATGQECPPFRCDDALAAGMQILLNGWIWQIHAAPGHDPNSVVFYQAEHGILISADALWENGFGVVFPELEGIHAFEEVDATLQLIEQLSPNHIIPGHGNPFSDLATALERAHVRLAKFKASPEYHRHHALKVLLKFKLLEWQQITFSELHGWCEQTPYLFKEMNHAYQRGIPNEQWLMVLINDLCRSGAAQFNGEVLSDK
jgi:glyoxylase-like metal-dependent hydrolase (beta-lactamase superfamily II)